HREWLYIELRSDWKVGNTSFPTGALLACKFDDFMKGEGNAAMHVIFRPTERKSLAGYSPTRHFVIINELDNVRNRLYRLEHKDDDSWHREALPGNVDFATASAFAIDPDENDEYFLSVAGYLTPSSLSYGNLATGNVEK